MNHSTRSSGFLRPSRSTLASLVVYSLVLTSCSRGLTESESTALLQTADLVTVHDAERLIRRILALQVRLDEVTLDNPNLPSFLRWQMVEPYTLTTAKAQDNGYKGAEFRPVVVIAHYSIDRRNDRKPLEEITTSDNGSELAEYDDNTEDIPADEENKELERGYIAVLRVVNGSSAVWPVAIIEPQNALVVASNLRDYLATEIMTAFQAPTEDRGLWLAFLKRLWVDLRLGVADVEATLQRNTLAKESSDRWLLPIE